MTDRFSAKFAAVLLAAMPLAGACQASNPLPACQSSPTLLANLKTIYLAQTPSSAEGLLTSPSFWLQLEIKDEVANAQKSEPASKANAAEKRTDQQTTAPAGASGSTSAASKGSVPWLLGLAEEYGGLTESTSGSVSTFKGNIANIIKAADKKNYVASYEAWPNRPLLAAVEKASFSIGFNTGTSGSSTSTSTNPSGFNGATAHIDIYNHRDPRDKRWRRDWSNFLTNDTSNLPDAYQKVYVALTSAHQAAYDSWRQSELDLLHSLAANPKPGDKQDGKDSKSDDKDSEITKTLSEAADAYNKDICSLASSDPAVKNAVSAYSDTYAHYAKNEKAVVDEINNSPVFSFEYTFTNQASVQLPKSTTQTYAIGTTAPNLSNFNFIYQRSLSKTKTDFQLTANASATLYTNASSQLKLTPVRDFKLTAELDIPVPALAGFAKSTVSLSGLYQDLLQEPLGQQVTVNTVAVTNTGNIVLGQAKWTFAAGTSGISFPVSFTGSNRTTLIKETDVKGTIGISYNLDNLFAAKSQ
jgi:hypothetical protein